MLDIRRLRAEPDAVKVALSRRDASLPGAVDDILARDEARRAAIGEVNDLKAERNSASKKVGELKRAGSSAGSTVISTRSLNLRLRSPMLGLSGRVAPYP